MARVIGGSEVLRAEVLEARDEAEAIRQRARREAQAERDADRAVLREQAQAEARAELAAEHLRLKTEHVAAVDGLRGQVTTLALAVAKRILGSEVESAPEAVQRWVDEAISQLERAREVSVHVHPDDRDALSLDPAIQIRTDPTLERGDCRIESELGDIDARLDTKLDRLRDTLERALESR